MGYLGGVFEGVILDSDYEDDTRWAEGKDRLGRQWCWPQNTSYEEIAADFVQFMLDNPGYATNDIFAEVAVYSFFSDQAQCD